VRNPLDSLRPYLYGTSKAMPKAKKNVPRYAITSIHLKDADDLDRIKQAAERAGKTVSAFLAEVAVKAANKVLGQQVCTKCGRFMPEELH
jgi:uncharacterized protein (DUF1778 family)